MQHTGQGSEKKSYRVILLLIVGLAAFTSAMRELNKVHALTLETGQLIARWTDRLPRENNEMLVKVDTCDSKILPPLPPLPALPAVPPVPDVPAIPPSLSDIEIEVPAAPAIAPKAPEAPRVKPRRVVRVQHGAAASAHSGDVRVFVPTEEVVDKALKYAFEIDVNQKAFKAKNRRNIVIGSDGRDVILKSLNRSINLRAS